MMSSSPSSLLRKGGLALAAIVLVSTGVIYMTGDDSAAAPRLEYASASRGTVVSSVSAAATTVDNGMRDLSFTSQGKVQKIYVSIGDKVKKGEILARIDNTVAKENYTAAKAALASAEYDLDNPTSSSGSGGSASGSTGTSGAAGGSGSGAGGGSGSSCPPSSTPKPSANPSGNPTAKPSASPSSAPQPSPSSGIAVEPALAGTPPESPSASPSGKPASRVGELTIQTDPPAPSPSPSPTAAPRATPTCAATQPSQGTQDTQTRQTGGSGGSAPSGGGSQGRALTEAELEANVSQATTDLAEAKEALAGVTIKAPAAGTVLSIAGTLDTDYTSGTFITLGDLDNLQLQAMFTQSDIGHLKVGQPAEITLTTDQTTTHLGKVSHIDATATTTGQLVQYGVTITFDEHPEGLLLGQSATVLVTTAESENTLYVPARAVQTTQDGTATITTQTGQKKPVQTGIRSDLYIEITEGLTEGDKITLPTTTTTNDFPDSTFPG
ncbi:hypothetical protein GCM10009555_042030 [Acrocarpospora macrocephala]|uniref:Uncharacterized protein n=1 Tax=Acrocarpospora macrocephala TaxID=150177 RepID=A0A5M3WXQ4_9ACTN|nr:HlyD family efflux transporter periplasmic adaptor subunit [Acrocarpospora macrocephala]GES13714.1 hypothetical protein Amac_073110 [Acrocarpospora macrocephala]